MHALEKGTEERFVFGGNSTFTLESGNTGRRFTYKVIKAKNRNGLYFVKVLTGRDNITDYTYVGILTKKKGVILTAASHHTKQSTCVKALDYFMKHIDNVPEKLHVYHEGKCCCCGRPLTTPESIRAGYGPKCATIYFR